MHRSPTLGDGAVGARIVTLKQEKSDQLDPRCRLFISRSFHLTQG